MVYLWHLSCVGSVSTHDGEWGGGWRGTGVRAGGGLCGGYRHLYAPITAGNAERVNRSCVAAWTSSCELP